MASQVVIELHGGAEAGERLQVLLDKLEQARAVLAEVKELAETLPALGLDVDNSGL